MALPPIPGIIVVDCSEGVAGAYGTRLLADLGATVIKVERPSGDALRGLGPFPGDVHNLENGGLHLALNAGKRSVVVDLDTDAGVSRVKDLANRADIFIESAGPGVFAAKGLGYDALSASNPSLVYVSHSPFGLDGPYANRVSNEIVEWAMGGYMFFGGDPGRHPLMLPGRQAELHAGMHVAAGAMIAAYHARMTGAGQHIDVSTFEAVLNDHAWLTTMWTHLGQLQAREASTIIPCADGHIYWMPVANPEVFVMIERPDLLDEVPATLAEWRLFAPRVRACIGEWAADKTKAEIYHTAQAMRIPVTPVNTMEDLANSAQLAARNWWREISHPSAGEFSIPSAPWNFSTGPTGPETPGPLLGANTGDALPVREPLTPPKPERANRGPLEGIRVLEITANWAGPLAGRHFADMGADVIKIEAPRRPATRALHPAGNQMWARPYNRAGYFNLLNRNKRDLVMDMASPEGRELFLKLVDDADIVLENNSARVFEQFRLGYGVLSERNPRIIMCSISGMGATGPERNYVAYGSNIEASSGLVSQLGYGDGVPFGTGSYYADPIAGTHATVALVAALMQREKTGRGAFIDMALQESGMAFQVEAIMDYRLNGRVAGQMNNRSRVVAPQGAYPSLGLDCWLAIGIDTDEQWQRLTEVIGQPGLASEYPCATDRLAAHDAIDAAITAWSVRYDHNEATRALQAAGIPAAPVLANWEVVSDPHLYARKYFVDVVHPEVGHHRWDGYPWKFSRTPGQVRMASPTFGQHNDEILRDVLGLDAAVIAELRAKVVVSDAPIV